LVGITMATSAWSAGERKKNVNVVFANCEHPGEHCHECLVDVANGIPFPEGQCCEGVEAA
jgi:hypothetical protein